MHNPRPRRCRVVGFRTCGGPPHNNPMHNHPAAVRRRSPKVGDYKLYDGLPVLPIRIEPSIKLEQVNPGLAMGVISFFVHLLNTLKTALWSHGLNLYCLSHPPSQTPLT